MSEWLKIAEPSTVAEARRRARRHAGAAGLGSIATEHVAIVATEIAQNILRHGGGGRMLTCITGAAGHVRLHVIGIDDGPGIERLGKMMKDGVSTRDSAGTGLGAIARLSDRFDIMTARGKGTAIMSEFVLKTAAMSDLCDEAGMRTPFPGERECGDQIAMKQAGPVSIYMLCDGLGHGAKAAVAADTARRVFLDTPGEDPAALLAAMGAGLAGTRGAVAAVVTVDRAQGTLSYAGIGNISTMIVQGGAIKRLPVRDGLLGGRAASPHTEQCALAPDATVLMHSDGVSTLRGLERRGPLFYRSAPIIAATLLDENTRGRDDASILAARMTPARVGE
ncbi:ATP-binding protein [uncultured Croceicoccus sp.]|uniref:ATP-binding protein n=1 Tax=uncultured Croceicoccus sp. TaxID=1295329 RepID=UPI0026084581|nr:ATP-binding protein [uncultured Croceicoccus sp.]